jgi:membrane-anchored glycerophosphoryl diester phosphodiesterase (GDPDase)
MASSNDSVNVISGIFIALVVAVLMVLNFWINGAFIAVQLASVNKHHITMRASLDKTKPKLWQWIGLQIVLMVIYIVAMVLLVIPFFFAMRRYILAPYYMIDRGTGIRESLRQSSEDSKRFSGPLWGLVGVNLLSQIIPIASILYMYAPAIRYKEITDASRVEPSAPDPTA